MMDLETFENFDINFTEEAREMEINEGDSVEYWDVEGAKIIKRKI